ncbi:MAG: hypothetical protein E5299_01589 [Burkholderia gladioli]|nr:MAG: hypothetical protein E5299_01589 [Burkholderia gladioli]
MHLTRIRVEREMDFTPRAPLRVAVLAHLPSTFSIDLQSGAVDNQMDRFIVTKDRKFDIKRFCPATERGVIRHRQAREGQIAHTLGETLQGAQRQSIDGLHAK